MTLGAIQRSATGQDCICLEPGRFLLRLRCARQDLTRGCSAPRTSICPCPFRTPGKPFP